MTEEKDDRPVIYLAHYVFVGSRSPQRTQEMLAEYHAMLNKAEKPLREKNFVFPIFEGNSRIEVLYPTPIMTEAQAEALHEKYQKNYESLLLAFDVGIL